MTLKLHKPMHKLINNGGAVLWIPQSMANLNRLPGNADVYAQSAYQEVPLGAKLEWATGEVFRYGKFGATSTMGPLARMLYNNNFVPGSLATNGYEGTLDALSNYAVGSKTLIMNDTTDRAENHYEDGRLAVYPSGHFCEYRIVGSEVAASVDDVTIHLQDGLKTALVVASTGITAYPSIFSNMRTDDGSVYNGFVSAVGVFLGPTMTANYFGWVQRKGRAIVTPTAYFGDTANERMAQLHSDGTIALKAADATHTVGYLTQRTVSEYGDLEIWLALE